MEKTITEQLTLLCQISDSNHSLQELMDLGFELFGNPLFLTDQNRLVLCYSQNVTTGDADWQRVVIQGERSKHTPRQHQQMLEIHRATKQSHMAHFVDDEQVPYPRWIKTITLNGQPVGDLVLSALLQPFTPDTPQLLGLFSNLVERQLSKESFVMLPRTLGIENLLIKLLSGSRRTQRQLETEFALCGWNPFAYFYLFALQTEKALPEIEGLLRQTVRHACWNTVVFDDKIVVLLNRREPVTHWNSDELSLLSTLREQQISTGISREFRSLTQLREAFYEAGTALRLGEKLREGDCVHPYSLLSVYHLLESLPQGMDPRRFCNEKVLALEAGDPSKSKDLLVTLLAYLSHHNSLEQLSDVLNVHRNTIRYRILKCMELMHTDLEDSEENNSFILSLQILLYLRNG